jgi:predicted nuclease of predicted toxin-antitoxin system
MKPLRVLVDEQLPPSFVRRLAASGCDAVHVRALGLANAADRAIYAAATRRRAAVLSKDGDFADLVRSDPAGAPVIWLRVGNVSNERLWRILEGALPEIRAAVDAGERLIEVV